MCEGVSKQTPDLRIQPHPPVLKFLDPPLCVYNVRQFVSMYSSSSSFDKEDTTNIVKLMKFSCHASYKMYYVVKWGDKEFNPPPFPIFCLRLNVHLHLHQ